MKNGISVHKLQDKTKSWLEINHISITTPFVNDYSGEIPHRDDHYLFFITERGNCKLLVDFDEVYLTPASIFYILPTQIHYRLEKAEGEGWLIAIDLSCIPSECRELFENKFINQQKVSPSVTQMRQIKEIISLLFEKSVDKTESRFLKFTLLSLTHSFTFLLSHIYENIAHKKSVQPRLREISHDFMKVLKDQPQKITTPSVYASSFNISESYLNEAIKKTTGFSVTYWIHQEIMTEAKRLIYHTNLSVKEVAFKLGFEDQSYFSRLFRKIHGISARELRYEYRK